MNERLDMLRFCHSFFSLSASGGNPSMSGTWIISRFRIFSKNHGRSSSVRFCDFSQEWFHTISAPFMGVAYLRVALIKKKHIASINIRILPDDAQNIIDSTINLIRREINKVGRKVENQMEKIFTFLCRFLSLRAFIDLFLKRDVVRSSFPAEVSVLPFRHRQNIPVQ